MSSRITGTIVLGIFVPLFCFWPALTSAAETNPGQKEKDASRASMSAEPADLSRQTLDWTVSVEALALERSYNSVHQSLITRVPGGQTFSQTATNAGTEAFNSSQFRQGFSVGPKIVLNYRGGSAAGLELSYFEVQDLNASRTVGPESALNWYVMKAPGNFPSFWQTQDFPYQGMTWSSTSSLRGAEANAKARIAGRLNLLAGFRWVRLNDSLVGNLTPSDSNEPAWKTPAAPCGLDPSLVEIATCQGAAGSPVNGYPPFWTTSATNNLLGIQVGADGTLVELGKLQLAGALKAGVYGNRARQSDWVSMQKQVYYASAKKNGAAVVGEGGLQLRYLIGNGLSIKVGYEFLWLNRVALAPGQISQTYSGSNPTSEAATGVNTGSNIFFQGGTAGLEYSF